ncbi:MAG: YegS/Rv2252/BmrU family lipid kinase [Oscillospiraceae bacterium]|nr:YegS/Rv2252/BmrU family lipid kinase [Oscillospiraceae bacterium]
MKKLLFIYNPKAGKQRITRQLSDVVYLYTTAGYQVTVHPTLYRGDATRMAAECAQEFDKVVCCGGDGTLNEVLTGLRMLDQVSTVGYLPAGSTNDFSKTLGLPTDLLKAAQVSVDGVPFLCDMGDFNGRPFVYVAAFGVFSEVSYATPQNAKNALGHLAYVLGGIQSISKLRPTHMKVTHDGETIEGDFIYGMVSDSISVGGFQGIAEEAVKLDDGKFEVMLVRNPQTPEEFASIINALMTRMPDGNVIGFQSGDITFESAEPVAWTLDGEFGGDVTVARVRNIPKAVRIMRGKSDV